MSATDVLLEKRGDLEIVGLLHHDELQGGLVPNKTNFAVTVTRAFDFLQSLCWYSAGLNIKIVRHHTYNGIRPSISLLLAASVALLST
jgi:hypothetical protein